MKKKIVVVGAGYAGILTAKKLAKNFKKSSDVEIVIIDKNPFHTMLTELHEVAAQRVDEDSIKISLKRVFAERNVEVKLGTVSEIDYDKKQVICETETINYDYLVLASGSKPTFFGVSGAKENAFTLWSFDDAIKIRDHISNKFREAALETNPQRRKELLTFFVVGCGFTGVEMAGELAELVPILCNKYEIDPSNVRVCDVDVLERSCMVLPPKLSLKVENRLRKMNVNVMFKTNIKAVGEDFIEYEANGKITRETTHTVIWTAGIEGSDIASSSDALGLVGRGRVQTDEYLRSLNKKDVFVGGDNIFFIPEGEKMSVPQMVENCEASAETIAHNLTSEIKATNNMKKYAPKFHGVMVCVGGRYGVANVGMPNKMFALPSFLAMFAKHFINILYFIQVLGYNKIFSYLKHEFFNVRNCRSFVGGHFSNRGPNFFLVPLRLFLGFYWVYEGFVKIGEGWLQSPKLTGFFQGANTFYDKILYPYAYPYVADAVSSASTAVSPVGDAATSYGTVLFDWNIFNLVKIILVNGGEYAFKIQVGFVDLMVNTFVIPNESAQLIMQVVIVVLEICIGLALMGGLFTTAAGAGSLVLQMMFLSSTGLYMSTWWMFFAGIAMLFGAGRVFSLDYYVMPRLKKWWKNVKFAKKWYVYND